MVQAFFYTIGDVARFTARSYRALFTTNPFTAETLRQCVEVGVGSLPIVLTVVAFVGTNIVMQGYGLLQILGATDLTGLFLAVAAVREFAPILTTAMIGAKAGSTVAGELATMRIREQIDALEVMSVDPFKYLIAPRFVAAIVTIPLVSVAALSACLSAGYVTATLQYGLNGTYFMNQVYQNMQLADLVNMMFKCFVAALAAFPTLCYAGYMAHGGPRGVGDATNRAVVWGAGIVIVLNAVLTAVLYG